MLCLASVVLHFFSDASLELPLHLMHSKPMEDDNHKTSAKKAPKKKEEDGIEETPPIDHNLISFEPK